MWPIYYLIVLSTLIVGIYVLNREPDPTWLIFAFIWPVSIPCALLILANYWIALAIRWCIGKRDFQ